MPVTRQMKKRNTNLQLHHLILMFQRRVRQLRIETPFPIKPAESILLTLLKEDSAITPSRLGEKLSMPRSSVSRLLRGLVEQGILNVDRAEHDARSKSLRFTRRGENFLNQLTKFNNLIAEQALYCLTPDQKRLHTDLMEHLTSGLGATEKWRRKFENPFVRQQRRMALASGMIGASYMGTKFDLPMFQLMHELYNSPGPRRFGDITSALPFEVTGLTRDLKWLCHKGWLSSSARESSRGAKDGRAVYYKLTPSGQREIGALERSVSDKFARALDSGGAGVGSQKRLIEILESALRSAPQAASASGVKISRCETDSELQVARAFLVECLVDSGRHLALGEQLLPSTSEIYLGTRGSRTVAVAEFSKAEQILEISRLSTAPGTSSGDLQSFLLAVLTNGFLNNSITRIRLGITLGGRIALAGRKVSLQRGIYFRRKDFVP